MFMAALIYLTPENMKNDIKLDDRTDPADPDVRGLVAVGLALKSALLELKFNKNHTTVVFSVFLSLGRNSRSVHW